MAEPVLQVKSLVKYFGALCATDHVSLDVRAGEIHALIGPNGAGKTSLVAQLSGLLASDSGEVVFMNQNISALSAHQRVRLGMVRSFQITRLFKSFTVRDNVALAVQARTGNPYSFWRPVAAERALHDEAESILQDIGLAERADELAQNLSHGEQRVLEARVPPAAGKRVRDGVEARRGLPLAMPAPQQALAVAQPTLAKRQAAQGARDAAPHQMPTPAPPRAPSLGALARKHLDACW